MIRVLSQTGVRWIVIVAGILFVVLGLQLAWYVYQPQVKGFFGDIKPSVVLGIVAASQLFEISDDEATFVPVSMPGQPEGRVVIDRVNATYVLLDPVSAISQLVQVAKGGQMITLTSSPTLKYRLSYDASSQTYVYLAATLETPEDFFTTNTWNITTYGVVDGVERVIATGTTATAVPGGVLVSTDEGLTGIDLVTGETTLISESPVQTLAVSADGSLVALFNPQTRAVDLFTISKNFHQMSYHSSLPVSTQPSALFVTERGVIAATPSESGTATRFVWLGASQEVTIEHPNQSLKSAVFTMHQ